MLMRVGRWLSVFLWWMCLGNERIAESAQSPDETEASSALRQAVDFFDGQVSVEGAYLWRYGSDLSKGEGEGRASKTTAWVQPPGTPTVGEALLDAYQRTGDSYLLDAARHTAQALVRGQLASGGWDYRIEFAAGDRRRYAYHVDQVRGMRNVTTLDDNTTQSALRFLMKFHQAESAELSERIRPAVTLALESLLAAQYPNGAWPQRFSEAPDGDRFPVKEASFPPSWSRQFSNQPYREHYTLNDNTLSDMISTFLLAARLYDNDRYLTAAERAGDFLILAQLPDPQPAWAQQYNALMHPSWARKFEPPSVTGGESQQVLRILMQLYRETGKRRFLEPIPRALDYLKSSQLADGRLARFYELQTNRPLYFTRDYALTYQDDDMPTHYAFKISSRLDSIEAEFSRLRALDPAELARSRRSPARPARLTDSLRRQAAQVISAMDSRGAWVEPGRLIRYGDDDSTMEIIDCRTFVRNTETLSRFIEAHRESD